MVSQFFDYPVRTVLVAAAALLAPSLASATETKQIAKCYGDHHGSYLNLSAVYGSEGLAQINIAVTNDGENQTPRFFQITELTKNGVAMPVRSWSWVIRQAMKASARDDFYGFVMVSGKGTSGQLYLNLNKPVGELRNALVINGYVEELTCPLELIRD